MDPQMLAMMAAMGQEPRIDEESAKRFKDFVWLMLVKSVRNDRSGFKSKRALWDAISMIGAISQRAADPNAEMTKVLSAMTTEQAKTKKE